MARWIETAVYWQGDLLSLDRRPLLGSFGSYVEGKREVGATVEVVRVRSDEASPLRSQEPDFEFARVLILTALVATTFLVMVALTPKQEVRLAIEEPVTDLALRRALLAPALSDGTRDERTLRPQAPLAMAPGGPKRIVIPTPPGSRVRRGEDAPLAIPEVVEFGMLGILTDDGAPFETLVGIEGGIEGGVVGGVLGTSDTAWGVGGGVSTAIPRDDTRCSPLVDHMIQRGIAEASLRRTLSRACDRATPAALDCLERAMSRADASRGSITTQCGDVLPRDLAAVLSN